jgi:hypothetical protein
MSPEALLRIVAAVAGRHSAADMVRVEVPYARGMDMWKLEKPGKFPSSTKDAVRDIVKGHGGKNPKYEEDGLQFDVPADKADSAVEDVKNLSGIDKAFKSLFDAKKAVHWKRDEGAKEKPAAGKKLDPKLDVKSEKYEQKLEKKLQKDEAKKPAKSDKPAKEEESTGILPDDPVEEWNEILDDFGVEGKKRLRKPTSEAPPKLDKGKPAPKKAPKSQAPAKPTAKPAGTPAGRRRPGPPPKEKFLKSLDRMSQVIRDSDDQGEIVEAVEDFLDGIRYDSWPESA